MIHTEKLRSFTIPYHHLILVFKLSILFIEFQDPYYITIILKYKKRPRPL